MSRLFAAALAVLLTAGCGEEQRAETPPPAPLTRQAVGHYCGMLVADHPGPKGQIHVAGRAEPYWFSSARDTLAFTMLPEEPKDVAAVYVTDMGRAASWENPGDGAWIDARRAHYVIGSSERGGMGQLEAVPFADAAAAAAFAARHGGRVVAFAEVPRDYVLGGAEAEAAPAAGHGEH